MDATGTPFTASGSAALGDLPYLAGIDVTSSGNTAGSLVLYGDQTISALTPRGVSASTAADLTADLAKGGPLSYGVIDEGTNGWSAANNNLLPAVVNNNLAPLSALNPVDRSILTAANVRTVLISTGTSDILNGAGATDVEDGLTALAQQVRQFYADTVGNNPRGQLTVYVATIPPDSRFTAAQEQVREDVNSYILGGRGSYLNGNADGVIDFAAAVSADGTDAGATVNLNYLNRGYPNNAYYQALAQQFVTSTDPSTGTVGIQPNVIRVHLPPPS
jgi:hypothetical protein